MSPNPLYSLEMKDDKIMICFHNGTHYEFTELPENINGLSITDAISKNILYEYISLHIYNLLVNKNNGL